MSLFQNREWNHSLRYSLLLMAPFDLLASLAMDVYLPALSQMPKILSTTPEMIQLTLSLYMITLGPGQLVFGPLSDKIGRRPVILWGAVMFMLASLILSFQNAILPFIVFRLIQGVGASAMLVSMFATVRDVYGTRPEGATIYSLFSSMLAFVPALGPILGALIIEDWGWRAIFLMLSGISCMAYLHALLRWSETKPAAIPGKSVAFRDLLLSPQFWTYTIGFSTAMGSFFVFFSTAPRLLISSGFLSEFEFSLAFGSVAIVMILTAKLLSGFIPRWGISGSFKRGILVIMIGAICASIFHHGTMSILGSMYVIAAGIVMTVSVSAHGALDKFSHMAGSATAMYYTIQSLIVGILGTICTMALPGDTVWPLVSYSLLMGLLSLLLVSKLK